MNSLLPPDPAARRGERFARWSVVVAVAAVLALGGALAWKEGWFTPVSRYHFEAASSKSLRKGMAVRLSGFKIGQVTRVTLQPDRRVRVELEVFRSYLGFVKADSELRLEADLPLADASLELTGGTEAAAPAAVGAALRYRDEPQSYDRLLRFVEKLEPMVENLTAVLHEVRQPQGEWQASLRHVAETSARLHAWLPGFLQRTDTTLAALDRVTATATSALTPLAQPDGDFQTILREARLTVTDLRTAFPPLLTDLRGTAESLHNSAVALEPAIGRLAPQLPTLIDDARRSVHGAGEVLDAVKTLPLIRSRVNQIPVTPLLPTNPP